MENQTPALLSFNTTTLFISTLQMIDIGYPSTPFNICLFLFILAVFFIFISECTPPGRKKTNPVLLPPGPKPWPLFGNLPEMLKNRPVFRWIHKLMEEMNTEILCIRIGNVHVVAVSSPELGREFLKKQDAVFSSRPKTMASDLASRGYLSTILTPLGEQWKKMRRVVTSEVLSPARHRWMHDKRVDEADHLVRYVFNQCAKGVSGLGLVNVRVAAQHYCGNLIRKMILGRRFFGEGMEDGGPGVEEEEHVKALFTILDYLYSFCVSDYFPFLRGFDLDGHEKVMKKAMASMKKFHDPIINARIRQGKDGEKEANDLLDVLIRLKDANGGPLLSEDEIKAQIVELMIATVDNPSNAIEWALAEMLNRPETFQQATKELDRVVGKDSRPGLGRNPKVWDEPLKFKPERHLKDGSEVVLAETDLRMLSFSTGRRGCVGVNLGSTMTTMLLARLLQGFSWSMPPNVENIELIESVGDLFLATPLLALARPRLAPSLAMTMENKTPALTSFNSTTLITSTLQMVGISYPLNLFNFFLLLLVIGMTFIFISRYARLSRKKTNSVPLPPGPKPWPLMGNLPEMLRNKPVFRWIHKLMDEMNTEILCIRLGNVHVIAVSCPKLGCEFLKKQDAVFSSRPETMASDLASSRYLSTALTPLGEQWRKMRRVVTSEVLAPARHRWMHDKRVEEADHLVRYVLNQCAKGVSGLSLVNVRVAAKHYCGNVIRKMILGRRFFGEGMEDGGPGVEEEEHVEALFTILGYLYSFCVSDYFPFLRGFDLDGHEKVMKEAMASMKKLHDPIINARIRQGRDGEKEANDLLDVLIRLKDADGGPLLSEDEIKAQIVELMIATVDNPSNAIEWALAEMLNRPETFQQATEELDRVVGKDRWVQESDISQLNYVKACAREAFRLHPIAPFNVPHVSVSDTTVAGYFIPKGSHVLLSRPGLGRNPKVWDEPLKFKPERHLKDGSEVVLAEPDLRMLSFSTGRRGCVGVNLGSTMTTMLLARLLQGFTWSMPPNVTSIELIESVGNLFLATPLLALARPRLEKGPVNLPPSPPKLPIIGNLHQLGKLPHYSLWKLSHKYGPVMLMRLGRVPTLIVSTPATAKEVLKTHDLDCCTRPLSNSQKKISYNFLDLAFSPYGEYWREMRKLCVVELFTNKRVQSFWYVREAEVAHMISKIAKSYPNPVEMSDLCFNLTNSVICRIAFGTSHRSNQFEYGELKGVIDDAMAVLSGFAAADFFPSMGWLIDVIMGQHSRIERCFKNFDAFFQKVIDEHLDPARPTPDHEDITDAMLGLAERTTIIKLNNQHMKAVLVDIFLGAVDTSSVTMVWVMAELIKNPRVMKKVQAEIRSCIGKKPKVDESELDKLKYFKLVVKETLRLHPPASLLIPHETIRHFKLNGYDILPKTRVIVNAWAIGRDPEMWENPNEFYPERFEGKSVDYKGQNFEFLPFGSGRRMCPGINMGLMSVEFTVANLLHCFDWELPAGMKSEELNMDEEFGLNIRKRVPLYLVPIKHNWEDN
ncbi:hypothetical protein RJ640_025227 [Escallonia rubra]|uniref:Cytochrome P450 n=1 Tax=Escallonia rubra TaxID=112253 RepID=A0AA88RV32_9ASTE|nr:hypothetical protein RJ640_025227 [Escallonia rubra]